MRSYCCCCHIVAGSGRGGGGDGGGGTKPKITKIILIVPQLPAEIQK